MDAPHLLLAASNTLALGGSRPAAGYLTGDFLNNPGCPGKSVPIQLVWGGGAATTTPIRIQTGSPGNILGGLGRMVRGTVHILVFPVSGLGLNMI